MFRIVTVLLLLGALSACKSYPVGNENVPEPAKPVELGRYLGKWYELARYENRFEEGCEGVTAEYSLLEDERIGVLNTCHKGSVDGETETAKGKAKIVPGSQNTKLKVSFFGPFYFGDYWVLDRADDYSWSIVGEPSGKYLWILSRQPALPQKKFDSLIKTTEKLGYNTDLIRVTKQGK